MSMPRKLRVPAYIALDGDCFRKTLALDWQDVSRGTAKFETGRDIPLEAKVVVAGLTEFSVSAAIHGRVAHRTIDPTTMRYTVGVTFTEFVGVEREYLLARMREEALP
jgi:predicted heme/steroid binding protein